MLPLASGTPHKLTTRQETLQASRPWKASCIAQAFGRRSSRLEGHGCQHSFLTKPGNSEGAVRQRPKVHTEQPEEKGKRERKAEKAKMVKKKPRTRTRTRRKRRRRREAKRQIKEEEKGSFLLQRATNIKKVESRTAAKMRTRCMQNTVPVWYAGRGGCVSRRIAVRGAYGYQYLAGQPTQAKAGPDKEGAGVPVQAANIVCSFTNITPGYDITAWRDTRQEREMRCWSQAKEQTSSYVCL